MVSAVFLAFLQGEGEDNQAHNTLYIYMYLHDK